MKETWCKILGLWDKGNTVETVVLMSKVDVVQE